MPKTSVMQKLAVRLLYIAADTDMRTYPLGKPCHSVLK